MSKPVVVVGGGITGLSAAHELHRAGRDFVLLEAADRIGGKIDGGPVGPLDVDSAADGFLARQPEMTELCVEIGLGDDLVKPSGGQAFIWADGQLRPIPAPSVLGVPLDADAVESSGIISERGLLDLREGLEGQQPPLVGDATVGEVLRPVVGSEAFERLVDPLLGGINAGSADRMSISAGAPQLAEAAQLGGSIRDNLLVQAGESAKTPGPVFMGVNGGTRRVIDRLRERMGNSIRTGTRVEAIERDGGSWIVRTSSGSEPAQRVILTTPAAATARLIEPYCPDGTATLNALNYSSAVLVTFVIDRKRVEHPLDGSGFLVPRDQGLLMTACSWSSSKWAHYDDGTHAVVRVSAGRTDDLRWLSLDQESVVAALAAELKTTIGLTGDPTVRVTEWRDSLPQYFRGHLDRVDAIDAELAETAPGLVATGAAFRGLGLPACVRQGRSAARR